MNEITGNKIHFIGIGGIMMSSLAMMALENGKTVSGSDRAPSDLTEALVRKGAAVYYGQCGENIDRTCPDAVVYTAAIHPDNPEFQRAKERGIPMFSRAEYLGLLMMAYRHRIGVSGTHGKSSTTGMLSSITVHSDTDPTILCGAELACLDGVAFRIGQKEHLVYLVFYHFHHYFHRYSHHCFRRYQKTEHLVLRLLLFLHKRLILKKR